MKNDKKEKGMMARELVYYCLRMLTITAVWGMVMHTVALILDRTIDLTAMLSFAGLAFGGELLMLLLKRVFAKPTDTNEEDAL